MGIRRQAYSAPDGTGPERGRFAPSPSGPLHFGSLIAAVGSFLTARSLGGYWLVRIEDLDTPRVIRGAADAILFTLERFGLTWDGSVIYQSRRRDHYQAALEQLVDAGLAYPCTCSRREVSQSTAASLIYPGTCRTGIRQTGRPASIRLRTHNQTIAFHDRIQGDHNQCLETAVGDFVIRRADGLFAYQLAVVVDDAAQGITHIVRGSDLLESTPRQIYLQRLLTLPTPAYSHLPVAVDRYGCKLSKQTRATPLDDHYPGPALVAALRFLNQHPPAQLVRAEAATILSWAVEHWHPESIPTRPAIEATAALTEPSVTDIALHGSPGAVAQASPPADLMN